MKKNEIEVEQIPEIYQDIVEAIGIEGFLQGCRCFGGNSIYFPKESSILRPIRDEKIREEYTGVNMRALAMKYGLSVTQVRKIIKGEE